MILLFYVYEWYDVDTNEIFYVGKGCGRRNASLQSRNKLFLEYYNSHTCANRIIQYFESEEDALEYEHKRIVSLKAQGLCSCNLDDGGTGGKTFVWTPELRSYFSTYNPMKAPEQRERMSKENPMKNKEIALRVGKAHTKMIFYNEQLYTAKQLSEEKGIHLETARKWAKRGYDTDGKSCYYVKDGPKEKKLNKTKRPIFIDGQRFESVISGAKFLGENDSTSLCRALQAGKDYKGHKCKYADQQPSEEASK